MTAPKFQTQRLRDPVHGLIVFRQGNDIDELAWRLIDTPEFQRLRRIKQLGVSELVFPGATHTRFAHSIGVFYVARRLARIIKREIGESEYDEKRAEVALIAALLHDIGHGPFSHTFEAVLTSLGHSKRHETWTSEIIQNPSGCILPLLEGHKPGFSDEVSEMIAAENPSDIYHAIVSSSFDADRLDYLQRDRIMTGTGAGAIDFDWLMEHIRVEEVNLEADDYIPGSEAKDDYKAQTFCLAFKALPAAEQFLLSRYTMQQQVYFHKTTRCAEHMIGSLIEKVAQLAQNKKTGPKQTGLPGEHPLLKFLGRDGDKIENYIALDDFVVMGAIERMTSAQNTTVSALATRILKRQLYKPIDIRDFAEDEGSQRRYARKIDENFNNSSESGIIIKDEKVSLSIYHQVGGDDEKAHKKLRIKEPNGNIREIFKLSKLVEHLAASKRLVRYYFENEDDREKAVAIAKGEIR